MKKLVFIFLTIIFYVNFLNVQADSISPKDIVKTNGITYKKFSHVPFTGAVSGINKNGFLIKAIYEQGKREGISKSYHENGQLSLKANYKNDQPNGSWEWYNKNGRLTYKATYKDGKRILEK
jgi:antitoxin component YwqK of YwqJK toxin-antitoxin module|tara:strand:- start:7 stop:372 length:366 start_codon:yes stop_codon:yes gene_type:complete